MSIFKYRIISQFKQINKVEIVRETDKYVWTERTNMSGVTSVIKALKRTNWDNWFDSFDEAKSSLVEAKESELANINKRLVRASSELEDIKAIETYMMISRPDKEKS